MVARHVHFVVQDHKVVSAYNVNRPFDSRLAEISDCRPECPLGAVGRVGTSYCHNVGYWRNDHFSCLSLASSQPVACVGIEAHTTPHMGLGHSRS